MIAPVILSGGSGTRLWPVSTAERPKQFLPLVSKETLFTETLARVADRTRYGPPIIVANVAHEQLCRNELLGLDGAVLLLEPCARNTAAAIAMAAEIVRATHGPDAAMLVMPSDHVIGDLTAFHAAVDIGAKAAAKGNLVTFGICPTGPETGYGYIRAGEPVIDVDGALKVCSFTEKPSRGVAEAMLAEGEYYWNGGIFLYQARTFLDEIAAHEPAIAQAANAAVAGSTTNGLAVTADESALSDCPSISVDYAVMERSSNVVTVPLDAQWSDVGSWDALAEIAGRENDEDQLVSRVDATNCYVRSDGLKVSLLGVKNLLVVADGDRVLIMERGQSQDIKLLVPKMNGHKA